MKTREQLEDEVDDGKHDAAYWQYLYDRLPWRGKDALLLEMESGDHFNDFVDHLLDKVPA